MSTNSKMKPNKAGVSRRHNQRSKQAKRDDDVMNTNDSSIVSKRSVSKLYLSDEPDFYEPFCPKFVRRNPLINRGYWLRMHAIEQVVRQFLEVDDGKSKIVVNLGCGYDPLPFQFWHRYGSVTKKATFVDVDYPQLIERKRDRVLTNELLRNALLRTNLRSAESPVQLRSDHYLAIGCDLRDLDVLERTLRKELDIKSSAILFVAEVSATYMPVADSDRLIHWASAFENAQFCILEQYLPQGPDHPFAKTMLAHFKKLQASIYAIEPYPSLELQSERFVKAGWPTLKIARNLWELWSDDSFTPPKLRRKLDTIEPFDEWEEFALFGGHYFLLVASNAELKTATETSGMPALSADEGLQVTDAETIQLRVCGSTADDPAMTRRFTAAFSLDQDNIAVYGGQGTQTRLAEMDLLSRSGEPSNIQTSSSLKPSARVCHSITPLHDGEALLVGGRESPMQPLGDCWAFMAGAWTKAQDLPIARYRHSAASVEFEHDGSKATGVLVFGGKGKEGALLNDCILWSAHNGWHGIPVDGPQPSARFGATMCATSSARDRGLLMGGIDESGTVLDDVWEWSFSATPTPQLVFKDLANDTCSSMAKAAYARVGASMIPWKHDSALVIGGVSKDGVHSLAEDFLLVTHNKLGINIRYPVMQRPSSWPLLIGAGVVAVSPTEAVIAGGGAVCFSMGSFWNRLCLTVTNDGTQGAKSWRLAPPQVSGTAQKGLPTTTPAPRKDASRKKPGNSRSPREKQISRVALQSADQFAEIVAAAKPVVIEGQDIGPCTDTWTLDYLKDKIGPEREIVVHECSSDRMTFRDKNFSYTKKTTAEFLDGIANGSQEYLRAVSASQPNKLPTKLEEDFPAIANDFQIPEILQIVKENSHSSPLRISGPVSLWLHYDVLANILCQVRGIKTLRLYPPSDVKHLDYPPGGSSSNTDVLTSKDPKLRYTHPHIALLKPGDILFIPPMWSHTATPEDGVSVAVNVFWKDLEKGYAAGKDVYGNRDLQAYENGRRDVEKIIRAFKDVPPQMARFYLERLAGEIQDKADKLGKESRK